MQQGCHSAPAEHVCPSCVRPASSMCLYSICPHIHASPSHTLPHMSSSARGTNSGRRGSRRPRQPPQLPCCKPCSLPPVAACSSPASQDCRYTARLREADKAVQAPTHCTTTNNKTPPVSDDDRANTQPGLKRGRVLLLHSIATTQQPYAIQDMQWGIMFSLSRQQQIYPGAKLTLLFSSYS